METRKPVIKEDTALEGEKAESALHETGETAS